HEKDLYLQRLLDMEIYLMMKLDLFQILMILAKEWVPSIIMMEDLLILAVFFYEVAVGTMVVLLVPLR
ncbi:MAG: hypothetical protein PHP14_03990, partial [Candidatus Pacebacteria bacterium]|nr:hypothetical protein [Candidatus Paceibacterota bacterium]